MDRHGELISMESIVGSLLGGFGVKIAGAAGALWMGYEVFAVLAQMAAPAVAGLGG